jgi:hypothetical protein
MDVGQPGRLNGTPPGPREIAARSAAFFGPVKTGLSSPVSVYALALPCHVPGRYDL